MVNSINEIKDIYPFRENYYRLKSGYNYHYVDEGSGDPLVILHGNPSWSFLFRNIIRELSATNRTIAPDHLGFGLSDKPGSFHYRLETHIDNFEEFMNSLNLESVSLMMHDWGGPVAMGYAERYPEKIKRLIITNTAAFTVHKIPFRLKLCRIPVVGEFIVKNLNIFAKFATSMTTVKPMPERIKSAYLFPFPTIESRTAIFRFVEDIPLWPEDNSYELLVQLEHSLWFFREHPVCIIWGMKDWCFTKKFLKRWLEFYPDAEVHKLRRAGHFLFEDKPDEINEILKKFLKETENFTRDKI
jgi:haloalkane dehalogenase